MKLLRPNLNLALLMVPALMGLVQTDVHEGPALFVGLNQANPANPDRAEIVLVNGLEIEMVPIEGGSFTMGCTTEQFGDCWDNENPAHTVTLKSYQLGKYEVTQKLWTSVMGTATSLTNRSYHTNCEDCPVERVSWHDVNLFLEELNRLTGEKFSLPTEAQWEYAARGGNKATLGNKYAGGNSLDDLAWHSENAKESQPVGQKQPNELGLYDMSGNVHEWVNDGFNEYSVERQHHPVGFKEADRKVFRGGGWYSSVKTCRVSFRGSNPPGNSNLNLGFRLALEA